MIKMQFIKLLDFKRLALLRYALSIVCSAAYQGFMIVFKRKKFEFIIQTFLLQTYILSYYNTSQ